MDTFKAIVKILTALAAIAGLIYVIATYGDKIVAWAKKLIGKFEECTCDVCTCPCDDDCDDCKCEGDCDTCTCGEEAAEEVAEEASEEAAEEAPAEEVPAEEVAEEADFEG